MLSSPPTSVWTPKDIESDSDEEGIRGDYGQVPQSVLMSMLSGVIETDPSIQASTIQTVRMLAMTIMRMILKVIGMIMRKVMRMKRMGIIMKRVRRMKETLGEWRKLQT